MDRALDKQQGFQRSTGIPRLSRLPAPRINSQASTGQSGLPRAHRPTASSLARSNSPEKKNSSQDPNSVQAHDASSSSSPLEDFSDSPKSGALTERSNASDGTIEGTAGEGLDSTLKSTPTAKRRPRPSLSDRTIETLSQIPPSPSPARRKSSFFTIDSPMRAPPRLASSMSATRKSTGQTSQPSSPTKRPNVPPVPSVPQVHNSTKRTGASQTSISTTLGTRASRSSANPIPNPKSSSPTKGMSATARARPQTSLDRHDPKVSGGSKTTNTRSTKPKHSLASAFTPLSSSEANGKLPPSGRLKLKDGTSTRGPRETSSRSDSTIGSTFQSKTPLSPPASTGSESIPDFRKSSNSSRTLRETIAKAKAQAAKAQGTSTQNRGFEDAFDPAFETDPFSEMPKDGSNKGLLRKRVAAGRTSGVLNIAGMNFLQIPDEVMKMYEFDPNAAGSSWAESVDLLKFIAADNRFEELREDAFPDNEVSDVDEEQNFQFRGLEIIDLHGNALQALPAGLRWLDRLHTLNLSSNKLDMSGLEAVCQLPALKELYLSNNALSGPLTPHISRLTNLQVLEMKNNKLTSLCDLHNLSDLKILNVDSNKLSSLPFNVLANLPLIEITAYKNSLSGTLSLSSSTPFPILQTLDLSCNDFTSISLPISSPSSSLEASAMFPSLQTLNLSLNRFTSLPSLQTLSPKLVSLQLSDNALRMLPAGFTSLKKLKNATIRANDIRVLDTGIAGMDELRGLDFSANPLRERNLLSVAGDVAEIKRALMKKIEAQEEMGEKEGVGNAEVEVDETETEPGEMADEETRKKDTSDDTGTGVGVGTVAGAGTVRRVPPRKEAQTPGWLGGWQE